MIPYNPRSRRTPASSVLIPLQASELTAYRNNNPLRSVSKRKRSVERDDAREAPPAKRSRDTGLVVEHYNARPEVGVDQRQRSAIIGLRNFNNWVKSVIIARFAHPAIKDSPGGGKVLDLGCGKGGDLNKWQKARVREYIGLDVAAVSIDQARGRYESSRPTNKRNPPRFEASFATLDCYSNPLTAALPPSSLPPESNPFDVVSMQFCMHYAFENEKKARMMLFNVSNWLRKGGVFIGTIPNDEVLLSRLNAIPDDQNELSFGNAVYNIQFDQRQSLPIYGLRYSFFLTDAVENVPEYVVHWDNFIRLAAEYSLHVVFKAEFHDVYADNCAHAEFGPLLQRMKVVDSNGESQMDEDQWEAANIYLAFAFEKR